MLDLTTAAHVQPAAVERWDVPGAPSSALAERDEFGPIAGRPGLFSAPVLPLALLAREDLGHALCAWAPAEDLL